MSQDLRLDFDRALAEGLHAGTQRARRLTEGWFGKEMYCVACGADHLRPHPNNAQANDFFCVACVACGASFELKSGIRRFGATVPDGAFRTMIDRLEQQDGGPHLALLRYCPDALAVRDLLVVPAPFLTKDMILRRPPLGPHARRAGWVGCSIRIAAVPTAGRIAVVQDGAPLPKAQVVRGVQRATCVDGDLVARTWLVDTLRCIERIGNEFSIAELYAYEPELSARHPGNRHIRPKLRQQLQRLRDAGLLTFLGNGRYRRGTI